jgi:hypothetical protein
VARFDTCTACTLSFQCILWRICTICRFRYGYEYNCINGLRPEDDATSACSLALQSFRGSPCSDAVGRQKEYQEIMQRKQLPCCLST